MAVRTYYDILGLKPSAATSEIKRAYHRLARKYHPDSAGDQSTAQIFQQLAEAYSVLSDQEKRIEYDKRYGYVGEIREKVSHYEHVGRTTAQSNRHEKDGAGDSEQNFDADRAWDFLNSQPEYNAEFSGLNAARFSGKKFRLPKEQGSIGRSAAKIRQRFQGLFGGHPTDTDHSAGDRHVNVEDTLRGERIYYFTLDALESIVGTTREVALNDGANTHLVKVTIPAGINANETFQVACRTTDNASEHLIKVRVNIQPHQFFEREGYDIIVKLPISVQEAIEGLQADIPTPGGSVRVRIPPIASTNKKLRLTGKGLANPRKNLRGDLYVRPYVVPPDTKSADLVEALKILENHYSEPVRKELPNKL